MAVKRERDQNGVAAFVRQIELASVPNIELCFRMEICKFCIYPKGFPSIWEGILVVQSKLRDTGTHFSFNSD